MFRMPQVGEHYMLVPGNLGECVCMCGKITAADAKIDEFYTEAIEVIVVRQKSKVLCPTCTGVFPSQEGYVGIQPVGLEYADMEGQVPYTWLVPMDVWTRQQETKANRFTPKQNSGSEVL